MTGIYLDVDGTPTPIEDVSWIKVGPCGCVSGVTVASLRGEIYAVTAGQALEQFGDSPVERKRDIEDGWTCRPIRRSAFTAGDMGCTHEPRYGIPTVPIPDGYQWAGKSESRQTWTKHLVPSVGWSKIAVTSLCGKGDYFWSSDRGGLYGYVTCRKCERAAVAS